MEERKMEHMMMEGEMEEKIEMMKEGKWRR